MLHGLGEWAERREAMITASGRRTEITRLTGRRLPTGYRPWDFLFVQAAGVKWWHHLNWSDHGFRELATGRLHAAGRAHIQECFVLMEEGGQIRREEEEDKQPTQAALDRIAKRLAVNFENE
eukprot:6615215-Pyramimonas_sp.AAC.1